MNVDICEKIDYCIISSSDYDISIVIYYLLKDNYRYNYKKRWEYLDNSKLWVHDINQERFKSSIKNEVCKIFIDRAIYWINSDETNSDTMSSKLLSIGSKLKENKYISIIIKECRDFFII
jgi:hypothetical protein